MIFAAPFWWWVLVPAVPLVLALHVRRRRQVGVASLRLWIQAGAVGGPRARVRFARPQASWTLFLQLMALILFVGALARPGLPGSGVDHLVLVIDSSGAMTATDVAPTRLDVAVEWAQRQIERVDVGSRVSVVRAAGSGDVMVVQARPGAASNQLLAVRAEVRQVDWASVAHRVEVLIRPGESTVVRPIVAAGAEADADGRLASLNGIDLVVEPSVTVGGETGNTAIEQVRLDVTEQGTVLSGSVATFGDAEGPVSVAIGFRPIASDVILPWADTEVVTDREGSAGFEVPLDLPGEGLLRVALPPDAYGVDDVAWLAHSPAPDVFRVLWLGRPDSSLRRAFEAAGDVEIYRADALPEDASDFDLVVIHDADVEGALPTSVLWWNSIPPEAGQELAGATAQAVQGSTGSRTPASTLLAEQPLHPLSQGIDPLSIGVTGRRPSGVLTGADVLLSDGLGRPLVQARTTRFGREVVVGFDAAGSAWPSQTTFPVFIAALVEWSRFPESVASCRVSTPCRLPRDAALGAGVVVDTDGAVVAGAVDAVVAGDVQTWPLGVLDRRFVPLTPGLYQWHGQEGTADVLVASRPVANVALGARSSASAPSSDPDRDPIRTSWLLLLSGVLLLEAARAGWTDEGYLRWSGTRRRGPVSGRATRTWIGLAATAAALAAAVAAAPLPLLNRSPTAVFVVADANGGIDRLGIGSPRLVVTLAPAGLAYGPELHTPTRLQRTAPSQVPIGLDLADAIARVEGVDRLVVVGTAPMNVGDSFEAIRPPGIGNGPRVEVTSQPAAIQTLRLDGIDVPESVRSGERVDVGVRVSVVEPTDVTVTLSRDGEEVGLRRASLRPGTTRIPFRVEVGEVGVRLWDASASEADAVATLRRSAIVRPAPHALIVSSEPGAGHTFAGLLEVQGVDSDVVVPVDMPWTEGAWSEFDAAILMNVPALELHSQQQTALQSWVWEGGGALMLLGGENTFGPGGYVRTPLDELSPLSSEVQREAPEVSMVFVLDRSGSMQQRVEGVSRLEIAKVATSAALDLLGERSFVGVVAFDENASTVVPMTPVTERVAIEAALDRLQANGGTAIQPALEEAYRVISQSASATRHVVLFTDGLSQPGSFGAVLERLRDDEITLSTVGIGRGTDAAQLSALARAGGGTFHQTNDFRALPGILAQEALLLSGSPVEEGRIQPVWSEPGQPFSAVSFEPTPPLDGYIATTAKPEATEHLVVDDETPLLASWNYGLGRVLSFASHGAGRWSEPWLAWARTPGLWGGALGWLTRQAVDRPSTRAFRDGDTLVVQVEGEDESTGWSLARTGSEGGGTDLRAIAPGLLEARWMLDDLGATQLELRAPDGRVIDVVEWIDRWSADSVRDWDVVLESWQQLAELTGGDLSDLSSEAGQAMARGTRAWQMRSAPTAWMIAALAVWLATLANRYLMLPRVRRRTAATPT